LAEFDIDKIVIRVRKPHAPIEADFKNVEVELQRVK
jgi:dihydroneopterin aldolase